MVANDIRGWIAHSQYTMMPDYAWLPAPSFYCMAHRFRRSYLQSNVGAGPLAGHDADCTQGALRRRAANEAHLARCTDPVSSQIPTDRPDVLLALRVTYVCVVLFQAALFYTAQQRIKAKNDTTVLKWAATPFFGMFLYSSYFHACRYQEPPKPFGGSGEPGEPVTTTVRDYDLKQVNAAFSPLFIGVAIMGCEWLLQVTS